MKSTFFARKTAGRTSSLSFTPSKKNPPELDVLGLATPVRAEAAFALGHLGRHDEPTELYARCLAEEPDNFHYHSGLAYAAKCRQRMLHPAERRARIELAHRHFAAAQSRRRERVTNYYRQGMLFKKIQGKSAEALPLFETAVRNWDAYTGEEKKGCHQERKNFVEALYPLASCHLEAITRCLREDEESGFFSTVHKYFALGKVHFERNGPAEALHALNFAAAHANPEDDDYVFELLARVHLSRGDLEKAWDGVSRVPFKRRRPYFRWTEGDVLIARGDWDRAPKLLLEAAERDRRGRHKALLRFARLQFPRGRFEECLQAAEEADRFFQKEVPEPLAIVKGKLRNSARFLALCGSHYNLPELNLTAAKIKGLASVTGLQTDMSLLRGMEGHAANLYFQPFPLLIRAPGFPFDGRNRRPPRDPVNALLSFVYTFLTQEVLTAIKVVGLDPYLGALHTIDYGRPSLACGLVEEWRSFLGDRLILALINRRVIGPNDSVYRPSDHTDGVDEQDLKARRCIEMKPKIAKAFIEAYEQWMAKRIIHPETGKNWTIAGSSKVRCGSSHENPLCPLYERGISLFVVTVWIMEVRRHVSTQPASPACVQDPIPDMRASKRVENLV